MPWRDPTVTNEGPTMMLIFAIIAAGLFVNGACKRGKGYGVLSIIAVVLLVAALVTLPEFRSLTAVGFGVFLMVGLGLSFVRDRISETSDYFISKNKVKCSKSEQAKPKNKGLTPTNNAHLSQDDIYEKAFEEYESGETIKSLMAQAIVEADGNASKERAYYIKLRVEQLQDGSTQKRQEKNTQTNKTTPLKTIKKTEINDGYIFVTTDPPGLTAIIDGQPLFNPTPTEVRNIFGRQCKAEFFCDGVMIKSATYNLVGIKYHIYENLRSEFIQKFTNHDKQYFLDLMVPVKKYKCLKCLNDFTSRGDKCPRCGEKTLLVPA